jgi:hypothetical protein
MGMLLGYTPLGLGAGGMGSGAGDVTANFGALTLEGAGGVAVTGTSISSGDASGHWQISSGVISPSATGEGAITGTYNMVLNNGQLVDITIEANKAHVSATSGEISAAVSAADTADDGRTIELRSGSYGTQLASASNVLKNLTLTSRLAIQAENEHGPDFTGIDVRGTTSYLTLKNLSSTGTGSTVTVVNGAGGASWAERIIIDGLECIGDVVPLYGDFTTDYTDMTNYAITSQGGSSVPANVEVKNCSVSYYGDGIVFETSGRFASSNNRVRYTYGDIAKMIEPASGHPSQIDWSFNVFYGPVSVETDDLDPSWPGGPGIHADALQGNCNSGNTADWPGVTIEGSIHFHGGQTRGDEPQCYFNDDKQLSPNTYCDGWQLRGSVAYSGTNHLMTIRDAKDAQVVQCTAVRFPGALGTTATIILGDRQSSGTHVVKYCITEEISAAGSPTEVNNVEIGQQGATHTYLDVFVGPSLDPEDLTTPSDLLAALTPKAGGPADLGNDIYAGAVAPADHPAPWVNLTIVGDRITAGTIDLPYEEAGFNPSGLFTDQTDVELSSSVQSNKVQVTGVSTTGTLCSVDRGTFTVYESDGVTVRWADSAADKIAYLNDYIELNDTSSGSNSTQTDMALTCGTQTETWSHTTVSGATNELTNADFALPVSGSTPDNWSLSGSCTYDDSADTVTLTSGDNFQQTGSDFTGTLTVGETYLVTVTIDSITTAGDLRAELRGGTTVTGTYKAASVGTVSWPLTAASGNNGVRIRSSSSEVVISDITCIQQ